MSAELSILLITTVSIAFIHTIAGPDHYLPFIVMAKARKWTHFRTAWITFLCGLGHIGSSVVLAFIGIAFGIAVFKVQLFESYRGNLAALLFTVFGFVYLIWGLRKAYKNKPHKHIHFHSDGNLHIHEHIHIEEHSHVHEKEGKANITPWVLFTIFVLGPCEPLIPLLMFPAAKGNYFELSIVTLVFGVITIATMMTLVLLTSYGLKLLPFKSLERYTHAIAGGSIFACGLGMLFLGL
jgi:nickel/cobalt transporter (NicO) family protein